MVTVRSVLVDFDGTASSHDVAADLLDRFGQPGWSDYDDAWIRGEIDGRSVLQAQAAMLRAPLHELIAYAVSHCPLEPSFAPFVTWCRDRDITVTLVSDGFGFYIPPLLEANGIAGIGIVTNARQPGPAPSLRFDDGHPECIGCGTCKKLAVEEARSRGPVAFVGEGLSDRFGARYADVAFAKQGETLMKQCRDEGIPFVPWSSFDDVRAWLERSASLPGPLGGEPCPGWWPRD